MSGYIDVAVTLPGPDENTNGYVSVPVFYMPLWLASRRLAIFSSPFFSWSFLPSPAATYELMNFVRCPGAWTMGNLARPGCSAIMDGMCNPCTPFSLLVICDADDTPRYNSCDVGTPPTKPSRAN
jgi:hypothetical protein